MAKKSKGKGKERPSIKTTEKDLSRKIIFTFHAPEAREVYLAGEFNAWNIQALPMERREDGSWNVAIDLVGGSHEYKLYVDGAWTEDCSCEVVLESGAVKTVLNCEPVINSYGTANYSFRL